MIDVAVVVVPIIGLMSLRAVDIESDNNWC